MNNSNGLKSWKLETTQTNKIFIQEEIASKLNVRDAYCHLVKNVLSSHILSKNLKIKILN
jgi:hypothetical protein